jgi:decaprenylphospho-beta-D-erythro-pentofuranosid-2-ulose 2-reductase
MPTVLIMGVTSAIGRAVAAEFARRRYDLVLTGRDPEEVAAWAADFTFRHSVQATGRLFDALEFPSHTMAIESCFEAAGGALEGAVVTIGYLGDQALAERDPAEARRILDTNFTGCISALNILANHFERRRGGFLAVISSVAGDRGRRKNYFYGAAKAGLSAYLQGLRARLFGAGVRVITVKPGFVDTAMTFGRPGLFLVASPQSVGSGIFKAIQRGQDVVYLPWFWRPIMLAARAIPESVFKRLSV